LDKAFGFAVGLWGIGLGADVLKAKPLAGSGEGFGFVAGPVVGHDALDPDAKAFVINDGGFEEGDGAAALLVGLDLGEGDTGMVVYGDMDMVPADATVTGLADTVAGDAMADAIESAQLFNVDMDEFAGMFTLIAAHRLDRFQGFEAAQAEPFEDTADRGRRNPQLGGNRPAAQPLAPQSFDLLHDRQWGRPIKPMRS